MSPTVTISLADLDNLRESVAVAQNEAAKLREALIEAHARDPLCVVAGLGALARDLLVVMRFAVANLDPRTIRGWPAMALKDVADRLHTLPDHSTDDEVLSRELVAFVEAIRRADLEHSMRLGPSLKVAGATPDV